MGRVYEAEQAMGAATRPVALKLLLERYAGHPELVARFLRECETVSQLEHPNTVRVHDFGQTEEGELYIAMEFVRGESLADRIRRGPMSPETVERIVAQICGALDEAHGKGIVHRDLKPDNILLTTHGAQADFVKLLDFGIARRTNEARQSAPVTKAGALLGSPGYMSPEQCRGAWVDARSDIYTVGLLAYEMLAGRPPFDATSDYEWILQHVSGVPRPFEQTAGANAPEPMKRAILRALAKEPAARHQAARDLHAEMALGLAGRPSAFGAERQSGEPPPYHASSRPPGLAPTLVDLAPVPLPPAHRKPPRRASAVARVLGLGAAGVVLLGAGFLLHHYLDPHQHARPANSASPSAAPSAPSANNPCRHASEAARLKRCAEALRHMTGCPESHPDHVAAHDAVEHGCGHSP